MKTEKKLLIVSVLCFLLILPVWIKCTEDKTSFTFAHISDPHMFAAGSSTDEQGNNSTQRLSYLVNKLNTRNLDFTILTGDFASVDGNNTAEWDNFNETISELNTIKYFCKGNHDGIDNDYFYEYTGQNTTYYFDVNNIRFLVIGNEETFLVSGTCGINITKVQAEYIKDAIEGQDNIWLVAHYPEKVSASSYWNDVTLIEDLKSKLIGWSSGHEHNGRAISNSSGYIEDQPRSPTLYSNDNTSILVWSEISVTPTSINVTQYDAYTNKIIDTAVYSVDLSYPSAFPCVELIVGSIIATVSLLLIFAIVSHRNKSHKI
ncbi:MAG: metallophosphoesterase [Candidatus Bathyarchaeota archaeon]|nr:metallophosphoesterase [Candidatus Bathyarchaeum sp.]